uniref:Tudor domain-containing protein n=1 Tax=Steinernema glaseri TaxID=37863 RepID=A0A1I7Y0N9_9BILA
NIVGSEFAMLYFVDRGTVARVLQQEVLPLNAKFTDAAKWPAFFLPAMLSMSAKLESKFVDACRGAIATGEGAKCEVRFVRFDDASRRFLVELVEGSLVVVESTSRPDSRSSRHSDGGRKHSNVSPSSFPSRPSSAGGGALPNFEPLSTKDLIPGRPCAVSVLSWDDPENISFRPSSLAPIPEYMYKALSRDWETLPLLGEADIVAGSLYIAKTKTGYERVRAARLLDASLWKVFALDLGAYEEVAAADLKPLTNVGSFMKVMVIKCRLDGIIPNAPEGTWPAKAQEVLRELLEGAKKVQLVPSGDPSEAKWSCEHSVIAVPWVTCRLDVDGVDVSRRLVDSGVALQR